MNSIQNWNERLYQARRNKKYTEEQVCKYIKLYSSHLSRTTLCQYERGEHFPQIDTLVILCEIYGVSINYILFGQLDNSSNSNEVSSLFCLFMLMYHKKLEFNEPNNLVILDGELKTKLFLLNKALKDLDLNTIENYYKVVEGIKSFANERLN